MRKKEKLRQRAIDPLWLEMCRRWDQISPAGHRELVQAARLIAEREQRKSESPDVDAHTPEEC